MTVYRVLLLDFGGVCLLNPVELHGVVERRLGLPPGTFAWRGPLDPSTDELWQRTVAGEVSEPEYWTTRAAEVGRAAGLEWELHDYMAACFGGPDTEFIRPAADRTVAAAKAAGIPVWVFSNDLRSIHGLSFDGRVGLLDEVDGIVDASEIGFAKPDPRSYRAALAVAGVAAGEALFVDDQPRNIAGAEAVGLPAMLFDVADAEASWDRVRRRLGV